MKRHTNNNTLMRRGATTTIAAVLLLGGLTAPAAYAETGSSTQAAESSVVTAFFTLDDQGKLQTDFEGDDGLVVTELGYSGVSGSVLGDPFNTATGYRKYEATYTGSDPLTVEANTEGIANSDRHGATITNLSSEAGRATFTVRTTLRSYNDLLVTANVSLNDEGEFHTTIDTPKGVEVERVGQPLIIRSSTPAGQVRVSTNRDYRAAFEGDPAFDVEAVTEDLGADREVVIANVVPEEGGSTFTVRTTITSYEDITLPVVVSLNDEKKMVTAFDAPEGVEVEEVGSPSFISSSEDGKTISSTIRNYEATYEGSRSFEVEEITDALDEDRSVKIANLKSERGLTTFSVYTTTTRYKEEAEENGAGGNTPGELVGEGAAKRSSAPTMSKSSIKPTAADEGDEDKGHGQETPNSTLDLEPAATSNQSGNDDNPESDEGDDDKGDDADSPNSVLDRDQSGTTNDKVDNTRSTSDDDPEGDDTDKRADEDKGEVKDTPSSVLDSDPSTSEQSGNTSPDEGKDTDDQDDTKSGNAGVRGTASDDTDDKAADTETTTSAEQETLAQTGSQGAFFGIVSAVITALGAAVLFLRRGLMPSRGRRSA